MAQEVEISAFDLRYESYRMRDRTAERRLLASIVERGIEEPLEGVDAGQRRILLNGFKRYRCARKLGIALVPYVSLGDDEATGIIGLIRASNNKSLGILEQACFIDDLRNLHQMPLAEIAELLSRSKSWVSMRLGLIDEMSEKVKAEIFRGAFPVYPYMYNLRPFIRMNEASKQEVEDFVLAVSGKKLSVREIIQLAHGFFRGPEWFRREVLAGNVALPLERMREASQSAEGCSDFERGVLRDLEVVQKYIQRLIAKSQSQKLTTRAFCAQANLLTAAILSRTGAFTKTMRDLYDRTGHAKGGVPSVQRGNEETRDQPPAENQPENGSQDHRVEG